MLLPFYLQLWKMESIQVLTQLLVTKFNERTFNCDGSGNRANRWVEGSKITFEGRGAPRSGGLH